MYHVTQINSSAGVGGGERQLLLLARYLHGDQFQFDFILPEDGPFVPELERAGLPHRVVPMHSKFRAAAWGDICRILKANGTDLLHCHGARANWYGRIAGRRAGVRALFCTVHNSLKDYPYPAWRRRLYLGLEKMTAHLVDQWIAVSDAIRNDLVDYYGLPGDRIEVIPNGIDLRDLRVVHTRDQVRRELGLEEDSLVILAMARMTEQKGHRYLLGAIPELKNSIPKLRCLLVGDGPTRPLLERLAERLGIGEHIRFVGFRSDVADLLNAADIYALPSISEGMPIGLLEAMACGCPVAASAVSGVPEVIADGVTGLLVPPADVPALVGALVKLAKDDALRRRLALSARERVLKNFTAEHMCRRMGELYRFHLKGGNAPLLVGPDHSRRF